MSNKPETVREPRIYDSVADFPPAWEYGVGPIRDVSGCEYWCDGAKFARRSMIKFQSAVAKPFAGGGGNTNTTAQTFHTSLLLPFGFYAVTPVIFNGQATASAGARASVGVGVNAATPFTPTTLVQATLAGAADFTIPAALSAGGAVQVIPSVTELDVAYIKSIPRTDGGSGNILMGRIANASGQIGLRATNTTKSTATLDSERVDVGVGNGDLTANLGGTISSSTLGAAMCFIIHSDVEVSTILNAGDSISGGFAYELASDSTSAVSVSVRTAQQQARNVSLINYGIANQNSTTYFTRAISGVTAFKPSMAIFPAGSPNDTDRYTDAWRDRLVYQTLKFIETCALYGTIPVIANMCPRNSDTDPNAVYRNEFNAIIASIAANYGAIIADRSSVYTAHDGKSYKLDLSSDGLHPNKLGIDTESAVLWDSIVSILG